MAGDMSGVASDAPPIETPLTPDQLTPTVSRREIVAVALWTFLSDLLIFRTLGLSGPGLFFAIVPLLFFIGCPGLTIGPARKLTIGLLLLVAARLVWSGSGLTVFSAVVLAIALSMSAAGCVPYVLEGFVVAGRAIFDGAKRIGGYRLMTRSRGDVRSDRYMLAWMLPAIAAFVFAAIFVFANPDLLDWVSVRVTRAAERLQLWLEGFSFWELPFCVTALLVGAGLMRPALPMFRIGPTLPEKPILSDPVRSPLYAAYRNTLLTLIVLFTVYLTFEFITLWKREFPAGFYYAGYAHQGAAWLTFALALATAVLSLVFNGSMLRDDRLNLLRRLTWIWSAQNLLLAAAVYNRLMIYVGYNGMTRLRTVAFFGTTVVVIGFCLVLCKIGRDRGFWWLIRAQLIALMLTVIVYSVFPVDYVVHRYNASTVASGYLHPSVMIAVKGIDDEGVFPLLSLTQSEDKIIRDGVRAMLAERQSRIENAQVLNWTGFQGSRELLRRRLKEHESAWTEFKSPAVRRARSKRFELMQCSGTDFSLIKSFSKRPRLRQSRLLCLPIKIHRIYDSSAARKRVARGVRKSSEPTALATVPTESA